VNHKVLVNVYVSFIIPEPQKIIEGMKNMEIISCFDILGYNDWHIRKNFQCPIKQKQLSKMTVNKNLLNPNIANGIVRA